MKKITSVKAASKIITVLAILFFLLFGASIYLLKVEMDKRIMVEKTLEDMELAKKQLEKDMDAAQRMVSQLKDKYKEASLKSEGLMKDLTIAQEDVDMLTSENTELKESLRNEFSAKEQTEQILAEAQNELSALQEQLKKIEQSKEELNSQLQEIQGDIEYDVALDTIVVKPDEIPSGIPEGSVAVVNKAYNFIVINLGFKDNIKPGLIFTVFQKNRPIGDVVVEKVEESLSVANFLDEQIKSKVREGDIVKIKR
ncbi:hypothetical protein ACFL1E_05130 [Candidatus Omnitrophota bacterium]